MKFIALKNGNHTDVVKPINSFLSKVYYIENPQAAQSAVAQFQHLRDQAVRASNSELDEETSLKALQKFLGACRALETTLFRRDGSTASLPYTATWIDANTGTPISSNSLQFEKVSVMYNIGMHHRRHLFDYGNEL
eukprot:Trichotokara_eunicae@DN4242_c0_g1_i1.p3